MNIDVASHLIDVADGVAANIVERIHTHGRNNATSSLKLLCAAQSRNTGASARAARRQHAADVNAVKDVLAGETFVELGPKVWVSLVMTFGFETGAIHDPLHQSITVHILFRLRHKATARALENVERDNKELTMTVLNRDIGTLLIVVAPVIIDVHAIRRLIQRFGVATIDGVLGVLRTLAGSLIDLRASAFGDIIDFIVSKSINYPTDDASILVPVPIGSRIAAFTLSNRPRLNGHKDYPTRKVVSTVLAPDMLSDDEYRSLEKVLASKERGERFLRMCPVRRAANGFAL